MPWPMVAILAGMLGLGMQLYRNVKSRWSITASSAPVDPRLHAEHYSLFLGKIVTGELLRGYLVPLGKKNIHTTKNQLDCIY
jgi:hypothetical protein